MRPTTRMPGLLALLLFAWVTIFAGCDPAPAPSAPSAGARVEADFVPGDLFEVEVYGEEKLSGNFQIQDDGSIDFPLIGRVELAGLTQAEAARELEHRLAAGFLRNPQVKIVVTGRTNFEVSVLGEVTEPGTFPWVDRMTLVQAISDAGGLTPVAAKRRVRLTRQTTDGGRETYEISLVDITAGEAEDPLLRPGDIVFVPEMKI